MKNLLLMIVCGTLMVAANISALDSLPIGTEQKVRNYYFSGPNPKMTSFYGDILKGVVNNGSTLVEITVPYTPTSEPVLVTKIEDILWQAVQTATNYAEGTTFQFNMICNGRNPLTFFLSPVFSLSKNGDQWVFPEASTNVVLRLMDYVEVKVADTNKLWTQIKTSDTQGNPITYDSRQSTGSTYPVFTGAERYDGYGGTNIFIRTDLAINSVPGEVLIGYTPTDGPEIRERFDLATGAKLRAPLQTKIGVTNGLPTITAIGEPTAPVVLEYTDSLTGSWTQITNLSLGESGSANYTCEPTSSSLRRFFRARYLP